jgi:DNA-binding response OmpR family regulator
MDSQPDKKAIVIVEDNEQIAELIKDTLNAEPDYQAVAVHDGALALEVIRSVKASLILLDVNLPGMDGLELYDMLQEDGEMSSIPVIFVTANTDTAEFKRRKLKNYIAKPFDLNELVSRVDGICRLDHEGSKE